MKKITQKFELIKGVVNAGEEMACEDGIRGVLINHAFSNHCTSGRNRLGDLKREFNDYLITHRVVFQAKDSLKDIVNAYNYNTKRKRYFINKHFFFWLKNYFLKEVKSEQ